MDRLLTVKQLGDLLQISPKTIYQWVHIGFIPHYKLPKGIRFRFTEVKRWLRKRFKRGRKRYYLNISE